MATGTVATDEAPGQGGFFAWIERVGNKVPHPVMMFLYLNLGAAQPSHTVRIERPRISEFGGTP